MRTNRLKNGLGSIGAVAGLLVLMMASPAFAQPAGGHRGHGHDRAGGGHGPAPYACGIDGCTERHLRPGVCFAKREFDRGYGLGHREGARSGGRDARWRNPFCDQPTRWLRRYSRFFAAGYRNGYAVSYRDAYYCEQDRPRRRKPKNHRRRWWW